MENENMVYEVEVMDLVPVEGEASEAKSNLGTGAAMVIGGLITAGVMFGVKKVKKIIAKRKAKKAEAEEFHECKCEDKE